MLYTAKETRHNRRATWVLRGILGLLIGAMVLFAFGCSATKLSKEDMAMMQEQAKILTKTAQDLGADANVVLWLEIGPDIGSLKQSITGPLKARLFAHISVRPKKGSVE
ncbi:MAG: hypothetical protein E3J64_02345 [Anaerolineales bacterium]|nr:MAG: hypothetical protein E3J64_02345 [Anaerolineales bacterium]